MKYNSNVYVKFQFSARRFFRNPRSINNSLFESLFKHSKETAFFRENFHVGQVKPFLRGVNFSLSFFIATVKACAGWYWHSLSLFLSLSSPFCGASTVYGHNVRNDWSFGSSRAVTRIFVLASPSGRPWRIRIGHQPVPINVPRQMGDAVRVRAGWLLDRMDRGRGAAGRGREEGGGLYRSQARIHRSPRPRAG